MARRALVTGGNRGIGQAIAELLKSRGYEVRTPGRDELDLQSAASVQTYLQDLDWSPDILINNAGINRISPLEDLPLTDWEAVLATNLTAPFLLIQGLSKAMKERRWGRILNISSSYSLVTRAGRTAYTASKSGLNGLTMSAAVELAPCNVLVNALCPGFVETDMTRRNNSSSQIDALLEQVPMGRMAEPKEIAEFAEFLVSERNTYLTGQCVPIDGGFLCR